LKELFEGSKAERVFAVIPSEVEDFRGVSLRPAPGIPFGFAPPQPFPLRKPSDLKMTQTEPVPKSCYS